MSACVLDASALLALLLDEPGAEQVKAVLAEAVLGVVNLEEIVSYFAKLGVALVDIKSLLHPLPVRFVPVDADLSYDAGMLRPLTSQHGLSLGDRCCLALARREAIPAMTADRQWADIAAAVSVQVRLIR